MIVLGVSARTIKRHIKEKGNIQYVGRGHSGHWEITEYLFREKIIM